MKYSVLADVQYLGNRLLKKILLGFCALGFGGCVGTLGQPQGNDRLPLVNHNFSSTRDYILASGICPHPQNNPADRRDLPKETRCLGGDWDSVALMITGRDRLGDDLNTLRLLWRDWKPGMHLGNDKTAAAQFVAVLAERYITPAYRVAFVDDFLQGKNGQFRAGDFAVSLSAKDQGRYILHRIELKNVTKRGTTEAPTWVPPAPALVPPTAVAPEPAPAPQSQPKPLPVWVNPNPNPEVTLPSVPQPLPVAPQPQAEVEAIVPVPVSTPPAPVVDLPLNPQSVAPLLPPLERPAVPSAVAPAALIPNFSMDEEENYIFKEFNGEISDDL